MTGRKYQAYSEYKNSCVEWLGDMPSHWNLQKSKYLFSRMQRQTRPQDGVVTAFRDGQVTLRSKRRTDGFTQSIKEIGYQGVREGDLLVHAMDGFAGAIGVSDSEGKCSPVCSVCVPQKTNVIHMQYYGYLVRQLAVTDFISSLAKGIRERSTEFRYSEFSSLELALPSVTEQHHIANFLDHETAKIDTLVKKQQQLIKLLKEKRHAVISHAVTKGLNPDAPMRDSGVEWLGEVPEHWNVIPLKHVCSLLKDGTHLPPPRIDSGVPLLSVRNIINGRFVFRDDDSNISEADYQNLCKSFIPQAGDVLLAIVGGTIGKVAIIEEMTKFHIQRSVAIFRARNSILNYESLANIISSSNFQSLLWENVGFSAQPGIYLGALANFRLPVPTLKEQDNINHYIALNSKRIDAMISKSTIAVKLLKERRTALISAAVTGKIDVRNWQAPEPSSNNTEEMA